MITSGTSVNSGNAKCAVSGKVVYDIAETPVQAATVRLRSASFLKDTAAAGLQKKSISQLDIATDEAGHFHVDSIDTGRYCIEVNDEKGKAVRMSFQVLKDSDSINLGTDTLKATGSISGTVGIASAQNMYVQVYGLDRAIRPDPQTGRFLLSGIPRGAYSLRLVNSSLSLEKNFESIVVAPADTTPMPGVWWHSRNVFLNTTNTGANITGTVYGFPVLVRLNAGNFNFSQALGNGEDIRFAKSDGTSLPYEIERWDAAQGSAEIWLKVDTVFGNDSSHYITMQWGASTGSATVSLSNSTAVFDTANGFGGVWHMGQAVNNIIPDATANHYDGTLSDTAPIPAQGTIGMGYQFDGIANSISMKGTANSALNFPENGFYTLCAWVYADTLDYAPATDSVYANDMTIISKDNCQYALKTRTNNWEFDEFHTLSGWQGTLAPATQRAWKYVVGVRQGTRQYLYVDGKCVVDSVSWLAPKNEPRTTIADVTIGKMPGKRWASLTSDGPGCFFNGAIDEVRIMTKAMSADYIKLCFMSQKYPDALIVFK